MSGYRFNFSLQSTLSSLNVYQKFVFCAGNTYWAKYYWFAFILVTNFRSMCKRMLERHSRPTYRCNHYITLMLLHHENGPIAHYMWALRFVLLWILKILSNLWKFLKFWMLNLTITFGNINQTFAILQSDFLTSKQRKMYFVDLNFSTRRFANYLISSSSTNI